MTDAFIYFGIAATILSLSALLACTQTPRAIATTRGSSYRVN